MYSPVNSDFPQRQVRALYDSHPRRHRTFRRPVSGGGSNVAFGFLPVERLWHHENGSAHKTANIRKEVVYREKISDLSVPIAMATCKRAVVVALEEEATELVGKAKQETLETAGYLDRLERAYHRCLLNTKKRITSVDDLGAVAELYSYYREWLIALQDEGCPILSSKTFKDSIAYQT